MRRALTILAVAVLAPACQSPHATEEARDTARPGESFPAGRYLAVEEVPAGEPAAFNPVLPTKHALSNGITVLLLPDDARPIVELGASWRVGSFQDPPGKTGLAELTAAVLRAGGGGDWPGAELDQELAFLGAQLEVAAADDRIEAHGISLAEDFDTLLGMLADVVRRPAFPQDKLDLELGRMAAEVAQRDDDPAEVASREARRAFYGVDDPRVRRVETVDLDAIGRADLEAFHRDHFGARGAMLTLCGDFEPAAALAALEAAFGDWAEQAAAAESVPTDAPAPQSRRVVLAERDDVNQAQLRWVLNGVRADHPDFPALLLGSYVFGTGGFSSRMVTRVRTELGLAYSTGAIWQASLEQQGLFWSWCGTKSETCALAAREMLGVFTGFLEDGVGEEEFEGARMRVLNTWMFRFDTRAEVLDRVAELELHGYPWDFDAQVEARLRALTREDVLAATRRHLDPARLMLFVVGDPLAFDEDLGEFGPEEEWDPRPPEERARDQVRALLEAHGGAETWRQVVALQNRVAFESAPDEPAERWVVYPERMRVEVESPVAPGELVVTEEASWWKEQGRRLLLEGEYAAKPRSELRVSLERVLMALAREDCVVTQAEAAEPGRALRVEDALGALELELSEDGRVRAIALEGEPAEFRIEYDGYREQGGLLLPTTRLVRWPEGEERQRLEHWKVNPPIEDAWFEAQEEE